LAIELANRNSIVSYYSNGLRMLWTHLKGVNLAETRRPSPGLAYAYGLHPAPMAAVGLSSRGLRYSEKSLALAEESGDLLTQGHCYTMRSMAFYTLAQYESTIADATRAIGLLSQAGDPYLTFIAESHASLSTQRLGQFTAAIDIVVRGFERAVKLGEDASAGPMLFVIAVATQGNFPFPKLRACFRVSDDSHFSGSLVGLSEGLWHLASNRIQDAVDVLQAAWTRAVAHCIFAPYTATLLASLVTALRILGVSYDESSAQRSLLLRRAWWNLRIALVLSWLYRCERAHVLREYGLLLGLGGARRRGADRLKQSIRVAESHGDVYQRAITLVELSKMEEDIPGSLDRESIVEAEMLLSRASQEIESYRRQQWPEDSREPSPGSPLSGRPSAIS
jgi:two-component system sensor kinase